MSPLDVLKELVELKKLKERLSIMSPKEQIEEYNRRRALVWPAAQFVIQEEERKKIRSLPILLDEVKMI